MLTPFFLVRDAGNDGDSYVHVSSKSALGVDISVARYWQPGVVRVAIHTRIGPDLQVEMPYVLHITLHCVDLTVYILNFY